MEALKAFPERLQRRRITRNAFLPGRENPGRVTKLPAKKLLSLLSSECHSREPCPGWLQKQLLLASRFWRSRCLRSSCLQGPFCGLSGKLPCLSLSFWCFAINLGHSLACRSITQSLPSSSHGVFPVSLSLHIVLCCVYSSFSFLYGHQSC